MEWLAVVGVVAFYFWTLWDFSRTPESEMRTFPRQTWLVLLVFGSILGAAAWVTIGRPLK